MSAVGDVNVRSIERQRSQVAASARHREQPPVLLTSGSHFGTLAAIRALGRAGIPVVLTHDGPLSVSSWSRYLHHRVRSPNVRVDPERFLEWLLDFGKRSRTRHVLLPTCDDTAWLYARHRAELARHFAVSSCGLDAVYGLLNKTRLMAACQVVGIAIPHTRTLASDAELDRIASFPLLIKPTTQVMFESREKGAIVHSQIALRAMYQRFRALPYSAPLLALDPTVRSPLIQEYFTDAATNIYNLSGYVGQNGVGDTFRASTKVLQERAVGVGLCFEEAEVDQELAAAVRRLFAYLGYHGIFEIEFIPARGRHHLIDANPRFYGQMAFDIARGMPLPLLAYRDALGDTAGVRALLCGPTERLNAPRAHTHSLALEMHSSAQRISGAWTVQQRRSWRSWRAALGDRLSDAVYDPQDRLPSVVDAANSIYRQLRFPKELIKQTAHHRLRCGGHDGC